MPMKLITDFLRKHATLFCFPLIVIAAFCFRNSIAERDLAKLERCTQAPFAPHLVESAVMHSFINRVADGQDISGVDPALPATKKYKASENMSFSLEYCGGFLLKIFRRFHGVPTEGIYERSAEETRFIRYCFCWYIALVPAFIFLLLRIMKVPLPLALAGAAIEIFSAAALGRYTGQDLIKGAFAMPLISASLACCAGALYRKYHERPVWLLLAALTAAGAVASWDASQIIFGLWAVLAALRVVSGGVPDPRQGRMFLALYISAGLVSLLVPYHQAHGALFSPVMQFALPAAFVLNTLPRTARISIRIGIFALLLLWSAAAVRLSPFGGNYNHFSELLTAKIKFCNVLPEDPSLLTFDQRYLWTPELHSATWKTLCMLFPVIMPLFALTLTALVIRLIILKKRNCRTLTERVFFREAGCWIFLTIAAFILCIFMLRFRDITVLFAAIALPLMFNIFMRKASVFRRIALCTLLLIAAAGEWRNSRHLRRGYPQGLEHTAEMIKFLRQHDLSGKTFLCDMYNSTLLKGYTNASILIQAKYELPEVRELTRDFILKFFNSPLAEFAQFCETNKVDYLLLHVPTVTTPMQTPYSLRYMANCDKLKKDSAALMLGIGKGRSGNFCEIPLPETIHHINGYRLYRFIPQSQRKKAEVLSEKAQENFYLGKRKQAAKLIKQAYALSPDKGDIFEIYVQICRSIPPAPCLPGKAEKSR